MRIALCSALVAIGVVAVGIAVTAGWYLTSPDALKGLAARLVERYTGRALEVDGALSIEVSLTPRLTATGLRLANAAGAVESDMIHADRLVVRLDLPALLERRIHVLEFAGEGVAVHLEAPVAGVPNWRLDDGADTSQVGDGAAAEGFEFLIQGLSLRDVTVFAQLGLLEPIELRIETLTEVSDAREMLKLEGGGSLNGAPWRIEGAIGPLPALIAGRDLELDLRLRVQRTDLSLNGRIADLRALAGVDVAASLDGPDASLYGELIGMREAFAGDVALTARIEPDGALTRILARGHIGEFELEADLRTDDLASPQHLAGGLSVAGPDSAIFGKIAGLREFPAGPFAMRARGGRRGEVLELSELRVESAAAHLVMKARLPQFPATDGGVVDLALHGPNLADFEGPLGLAPLIEAPFELAARLDADGQALAASLELGGHTVSTQGRLGNYPDFEGTRLQVRLAGDELGDVTGPFGGPRTLKGNYTADFVAAIEGTAFRATDVHARTGVFELNGELALPAWRDSRDFVARAALEIASLAHAGTAFGIEALPDRPAAMEAELTASADGYRLSRGVVTLGDARLTASGVLGDLGSLDGLVLELGLDSPTLNALFPEALPDGYGTRPVSITSTVQGSGSALAIERLAFESEGTKLDLSGRLALAKDFVGSHLNVHGTGRALSRLLPSLGAYEPPARPFAIQARILRPDSGSIVFEDLDLTIDRTLIELDGIADLESGARTRFRAAMKGESLEELGRIEGRPLPDLPFEINTRLGGSGRLLTVEQFTARWGDNDLSASGSLDLTAKPRLALTATSRRLDIRDLQQALRGDAEAAPPASATSGRRIPEIAVPFDALAAVDAEVVLSVATFHGRVAELEGVTLDARTRNGALELRRLEYQDAIGSFRATGALVPQNGSARFELALRAHDADLGLFQSPDQPAETVPRYSIDAALSGSGKTTTEIAATLDGSILVVSDGGKIFTRALDMWAGDFLQNVLELLNPFTAANEPFVPMDCLVLNAKLERGLLNLQPGFVMRTDKVNMFVLGQARLATETLDLSLATQPRQGIGVSAASITNPYFKIGGTFAAPQLQLDATSAALAYGFATATGGLSILAKGVWDRLRGEVNPCPQFLPKES